MKRRDVITVLGLETSRWRRREKAGANTGPFLGHSGPDQSEFARSP